MPGRHELLIYKPHPFLKNTLFLSALWTSPMRELWGATVLANEQPLLFHSQMRPTPADFSFAMMFYWYATHIVVLDSNRRREKSQSVNIARAVLADRLPVDFCSISLVDI